MEPAEYLLRDDLQWSRQKIVTSSKRGTEQVVHLPTRIPVHLLYWTAWANEDGVVHFRKDIYDHDKVLDKALLEFFPFPRHEERVEMVVKQ